MIIEFDVKKMKAETQLKKIISQVTEKMPYSMHTAVQDVLTEIYTRGCADGKERSFNGYTMKDAFCKKLDNSIPNRNDLIDSIFNAYMLGYKAVI